MSLRNIQLEQGIIYETIVATYDEKLKPNAAPMGIFLNSENRIIIQPYIQSDTFVNLNKNSACTINFTFDPKLFTLCTLFQKELLKEEFEEIQDFNAPILKKCQNNFIALEVLEKSIEKNSLKAYFKCKIVKFNLEKSVIQPLTRAFSLLIEILIHSSRIVNFTKEIVKEEEIADLRSLINKHAEVIRRVTQKNSIYNDLLDKILKKLS
ncbi:MAG TPA: DUF447 domain-containing protein [candidate division Zixibacteria bacterium]|nr:DUF447 domain-containing protein [candidate division Zixibacteria bacterium]